MKVTGVKIRATLEEDKPIKAVVSVVIDGDHVWHDLKIIEANGKRFVAMPSKLDAKGKRLNICHPITQEARMELETAIFTEYDRYQAQKEGNTNNEH